MHNFKDHNPLAKSLAAIAAKNRTGNKAAAKVAIKNSLPNEDEVNILAKALKAVREQSK